jgi:glycosyltransferase involved in cell wall biosynthesis
MAAGCFPVISDLPTQGEWIEDGVNGFRVPTGDVAALARRLGDALENAALRRDAAPRNRRLVEERGLWETYVPQMEALYRQLAQRAD